MIAKEVMNGIITAITEGKMEGDILEVAPFLVYRKSSAAHANIPYYLRPAGNFDYRGETFAVYFDSMDPAEIAKKRAASGKDPSVGSGAVYGLPVPAWWDRSPQKPVKH